jgi:hypothetical protein
MITDYQKLNDKMVILDLENETVEVRAEVDGVTLHWYIESFIENDRELLMALPSISWLVHRGTHGPRVIELLNGWKWKNRSSQQNVKVCVSTQPNDIVIKEAGPPPDKLCPECNGKGYIELFLSQNPCEECQ